MYHCVTKVSIFSKNNKLENWLKQITALEQFEHQFKTYDDLSDENFAESNLIILDFPYDKKNLLMINNQKKQDTLLVVCIFPEELAIFTAEDYMLFDDLWIKPLLKESVEFYFMKVMRGLKLKMELQLNQKYLDGVIESIPDLVWFKDLNGAHLKVNDYFCRTVGKTKEDVQGKDHYYIWDITREEYENGKHACSDSDETVLREKKTCHFDEKVKSKEGLRQLKTYKSPILDNNGEPMGTVGIARDVTDLWNLEAELEIVLEHIPFAVLFYDNNGIILSVNKNFIDYFGIDKESIVGREYDQWAYTIFSDYMGNSSENVFEEKININGNEKTIRVHREPVCDIFNNITGYFCIYSDITLEHLMQEEILHSANTDYLTGLYNRRYLYDFINNYRDAEQICLLCIDLDDFKIINDSYGHKEGDTALVFISRILSEQFPDQKIFRLGGDEFLVIITSCRSINEIKVYAQNLLNSINSGVRNLQKILELSASIGIVVDTDRSIDFDELFKRGDAALYKAKQRGKNQYYIWESDK